MRRIVCRVLMTGLVLGCMAGQAAESPPAPVVEQIRIDIQGPVPIAESWVRSFLETREGQPGNREQLSRDVRSLLDTERLSRVTAEIEPVGSESVRVVFRVTARARLAGPVELEGNHRLGDSRVRELLELRPGDPVDDEMLAVRARKVENEYRLNRRYPDAVMHWQMLPVAGNPGLVNVAFRIEEGARRTVSTIVFTGNERADARSLRKVMGIRPWWNPIRWFKRTSWSIEERATARLAIRDWYRDRGFLDVQVMTPDLELTPDGHLRLRVEIVEGPAYRFESLSIQGNRLFPETLLTSQMRGKAGGVAAASVIRGSADSIRDFYGSRGYVNTVVRPAVDPVGTGGTVVVRFEVTEGERVSIRNIRIRGNGRTRDKVIRRELLVYPGEVYNEVKIRTSERILMNLGYFGLVRSYPESTLAPDVRDLVFDVEEKRTGQFMVGAGFSSIDNVMGFMEVGQGNFDIRGWPYFPGAGQKLKLRAQAGSRSTLYDLNFVEPWFLDRRLSLGFDLYHSKVNYTDYDVKRRGAATTLGKALPGRGNRMSLTYRLESVDLSDVADTNAYVYSKPPFDTMYFDQDTHWVNSLVGITLAHDARDNPMVATRGKRMSVSAELHGGPVGGDIDSYGLAAESSWYLPLWRKHVLSARLKYEVVDAYGTSDDVPVSERLFLGGGRTLRGFDFREVGPKVVRTITASDGSTSQTVRPAGGQSLVLGNVEYWIPLVTGIRFATFFDVGNVWRDAYELHPDDLAMSYGMGIRFDIPGFPIRIDRGWILEKDDPLTGADEWVFWIGYDF